MVSSKLKSDYMGGIIIFGIMFTISIVSFYVVKTISGKQATKYNASSSKELCINAGGNWTGDMNPEDPCCLGGTDILPQSVPRCLGEGISESGLPFP